MWNSLRIKILGFPTVNIVFCVLLHIGLLCCMKCNNTYTCYVQSYAFYIGNKNSKMIFIKFLHRICKTLFFLKSRDRITLLDQSTTATRILRLWPHLWGHQAGLKRVLPSHWLQKRPTWDPAVFLVQVISADHLPDKEGCGKLCLPLLARLPLSTTALSNVGATTHTCLLKCKLIKSSPSHTCGQ